jgi:hypothetical protein
MTSKEGNKEPLAKGLLFFERQFAKNVASFQGLGLTLTPKSLARALLSVFSVSPFWEGEKKNPLGGRDHETNDFDSGLDLDQCNG